MDHLMIHENNISEYLKEFCKNFGIGLLQVNDAKIVTEIVIPENHRNLINSKVESACNKRFYPDTLKCPDCGMSSLKVEFPWGFFADKFMSSSRNKIFKGVPDYMPEIVGNTPLLKKLFTNRSKVKENWKEKCV